jgi:hypothetical protein
MVRNKFNITVTVEKVLDVLWLEVVIKVADICNKRGFGGNWQFRSRGSFTSVITVNT